MVQICELTLKVKHLPSCLNDSEKEDFLIHFGAQQVKVITSISKQKSVVYGKFESKSSAKAVLHRIHQLRVLDTVLCVEYAEKKIADSLPAPLISQPTELQSCKHYVNYITKINALNSGVGYDQPPPAHLRYAYPKANKATINNIAYALDTVPAFYFQVLHLMNRMNLPPPFNNAPDLPKTVRAQPKAVPPKPPVRKSESESEIESDHENDKEKQIIPAKRPMTQNKAIKRPKFIKPNPSPNPAAASNLPAREVSEVFEKSDFRKVDKIELKVASDCLTNKNLELAKDKEPIEEEAKPVESDGIFTAEELAANRLPLKDLHVLQVFKDYHPGVPSNRLYVKNIAKNVVVSDLERIYKRYCVEKDGDETNVFEIKLMTEGRMKGQAFITLESVELGQKAVKETNGFILKDKPIVVVYAKPLIKK